MRIILLFELQHTQSDSSFGPITTSQLSVRVAIHDADPVGKLKFPMAFDEGDMNNLISAFPNFSYMYIYFSSIHIWCSCFWFPASWWQLFITLHSVGAEDANFINSIQNFWKTSFECIQNICNETSR